MHLIDIHKMEMHNFAGKEVPPYAILSHRWEDGELTFQDFHAGDRKESSGYRKLFNFCRYMREQKRSYRSFPRRDKNDKTKPEKLNYIWIDTCCIDKTNNTVYSEALNSMFHYYRNAIICIAYLFDVNTHGCRYRRSIDPPCVGHCEQCEDMVTKFEASDWFKRG